MITDKLAITELSRFIDDAVKQLVMDKEMTREDYVTAVSTVLIALCHSSASYLVTYGRELHNTDDSDIREMSQFFADSVLDKVEVLLAA